MVRFPRQSGGMMTNFSKGYLYLAITALDGRTTLSLQLHR